MNLKKTAAVGCAALTFMLAPFSVYADNENDYQNYGNDGQYDYQTTQTSQYSQQDYDGTSETQSSWQPAETTQPEETSPSEIQSDYEPQTTYVSVDNEPTETASNVVLEIGKVKDGKFTAKIKIDSESLISNASISVEYDKSLLEFISSEPNKDAGGMAADNSYEGKYVYNYINRDGTDFDGTYTTLNFKILDDSMISTVMYLTVESLDDENLNAIACNAENAIVKNSEETKDENSEADADSYRRITLHMSKKPISLESLGIKNAKSCTVGNGEVLIAEDGYLKTMSTGATKLEVTYNDGSKEDFVITIINAENDSALDSDSSDSAAATVAPVNGGSSLKTLLICIAVVVGLALIATEYIVIMKPFGKPRHVRKNAKPQRIYEEDEQPDEESKKALEKMLAERTARSEESSAPEIDKLSSTQQINKKLIEQGFIFSDDDDDEDE